MQIYLLVAKPSKLTTAMFRIHLNFLNGPLLAYLFPEIESRRVVMERPTYYIQHGLMFIIPVFMLKEGGTSLAIYITASALFINEYCFIRCLQCRRFNRYQLECHWIFGYIAVSLCAVGGVCDCEYNICFFIFYNFLNAIIYFNLIFFLLSSPSR